VSSKPCCNALEVAALSAGTKSCTISAAAAAGHSFASGSESHVHVAYLNSGSISSFGSALGPDLGRAAIDSCAGIHTG